MALESSPNWLELPRDITASILRRLGHLEILNAAQLVCPQWRSISMDPSLWTTIDTRDLGGRYRLCWLAVDRSAGGLVDLSIAHFLTDDLLRHITASCNGIKRLWIVSCYDASNQGLSEAAAKLPLLEDLELSFGKFSEAALEAIGRHCPRLTSLKYNSKVSVFDMGVDAEAQAIAKTMPKLRHLQLVGNRLTNVGLEAILSGCPHLEDLDLRQCRHVDLSGELGKRCAERIKNLRRNWDPTDDFEYHDELCDMYHSDTSSDLDFCGACCCNFGDDSDDEGLDE